MVIMTVRIKTQIAPPYLAIKGYPFMVVIIKNTNDKPAEIPRYHTALILAILPSASTKITILIIVKSSEQQLALSSWTEQIPSGSMCS